MLGKCTSLKHDLKRIIWIYRHDVSFINKNRYGTKTHGYEIAELEIVWNNYKNQNVFTTNVMLLHFNENSKRFIKYPIKTRFLRNSLLVHKYPKSNPWVTRVYLAHYAQHAQSRAVISWTTEPDKEKSTLLGSASDYKFNSGKI